MACNWSSSSHATRQPQIIVNYTNCPYEHNHNVPHDCHYDLETCGLFEPSGPNGSPESNVCVACHCHCHRNMHRIVMVHYEVACSPPQPQAARRETFTGPDPASEPGPPARQRAKRLTKEQSQKLRVIAKRNNYRMFKEYTKNEVAQICAEVGIKERILQDWISRHNVKRRRDAAAREAAADCYLSLKMSY